MEEEEFDSIMEDFSKEGAKTTKRSGGKDIDDLEI